MAESQFRVLIYSHDSFGLGHLRRCRAIACALVEQFPNLSVLILSGSPIIGNFDFPARVDFVRIPGVIKLRNGEYTSHSLDMDVEKTLELRSAIIRHAASIFDPHIFIVDKEPLGLRGEVLPRERAAHLAVDRDNVAVLCGHAPRTELALLGDGVEHEGFVLDHRISPS